MKLLHLLTRRVIPRTVGKEVEAFVNTRRPNHQNDVLPHGRIDRYLDLIQIQC